MNDEQIKKLFEWLDAHTYSGEPGTDGEYVRMEEMRKYLPGTIKKITKPKKISNNRIVKLAEQSKPFGPDESIVRGLNSEYHDLWMAKFAELIIQNVLWHQQNLLSEAESSFTPAKAQAFKLGINSFADRIKNDFGVEE